VRHEHRAFPDYGGSFDDTVYRAISFAEQGRRRHGLDQGHPLPAAGLPGCCSPTLSLLRPFKS